MGDKKWGPTSGGQKEGAKKRVPKREVKKWGPKSGSQKVGPKIGDKKLG